MVQSDGKSEYAQRQHIVSQLCISQEDTHSEYDDQRIHQNTLIPTQRTGDKPYHLTKEQTTKRRHKRLNPGDVNQRLTPMIRSSLGRNQNLVRCLIYFLTHFNSSDTLRDVMRSQQR